MKIAIMQPTATIAPPASIRQPERGIHRAARMTGLAGGIPAINHRQVPAVPDRLVFQLPPEFSQACIQDRLGQLGFRKAFYSQILDAHAFIITHQLSGDLVDEILSLVRRLGLNTGRTLLRLRPVGPVQLTSGHNAENTRTAPL